jgi:purine-binding chemotaxis protein CheW
MADFEPASDAASGARRFLTFRLDRRLYAVPAETVSEVIRVPAVARVPQAPRGLLGMANLRGAVLPVASLRGLLGRLGEQSGADARAIVLGGAAPVAVAVDAVEALVSVEPGRIETRQVQLAAEPGERLTGAFRSGADGDVAKVLDMQSLLAAAFLQQDRPARAVRTAIAEEGRHGALERQDRLISFTVADQEYALSLDCVREVLPAPRALTALPGVDAAVRGLASYRDRLLPLLSARQLLGLPPASIGAGDEKVVVVSVKEVLIGLVVDRMRSILPVDAALVEPVPTLLAARTGGEARIEGIYRGAGGGRLISILAPDQLFREDVMQRLGPADAATPQALSDGPAFVGEERPFLVFRIANEEFGLPIDCIDEVALVPEQITRVPHTPKFLEGVINLRGAVLPVVDQRRRFDLPALKDARARRLIVVRTAQHRAGLIVDSVSEVRRCRTDAIDPAPHLTGETTRLVDGVMNLQAAGRLILLMNPAELLSRSERGLLDVFQSKTGQAITSQAKPSHARGRRSKAPRTDA